MSWTLDAYITESGRSQVLEFVEELRSSDPECYARYAFTRELLREHGPAIGKPHWDGLGDGLGEIRWRCGRRRLRIYCSVESGQTIVMYEADTKKWRAFPERMRKTCVKRREDFQSASYDHESRYLTYCAKRQRVNDDGR